MINLRPIVAPAEPQQGMKFWLQDGGHWAIGTNLSIGKVNSRSFYVCTEGRVERYLLVEWTQWLRGLFAVGRLFLHGHPVMAPKLVHGGFDMTKTKQVDIDITARDQRFLRAATDVLKRYKIKATGEEGVDQIFSIAGGKKTYEVRVAKDWSTTVRCTCPDASNRAKATTRGFCKHAIATLLSQDELRYQLLDVVL